MYSEFKNRRTFLKQSIKASAAIPIPWIISASALGTKGNVAASERITIGVIGFGPRCKRVLEGMMVHPDAQFVAVCDVQKSRREEAKEIVDAHHGSSDCVTMRDFRELLYRDDIDAVVISTGDRWHAAASILAAKAGKDVYSEKPCGITIADCQQLDDAIQETGRIFQAGTQRRSITNFEWAVRLARSGKLGKVHTLHASVYRPKFETAWLPGEPTPDPEVIDWNMWLGPAPWRPYNQKYVEGLWRGHFDFDSGATLLDWGAHTVDLCQWANDSDHTLPVEYIPGTNEITALYEDGTNLIMHFLDTPFGERPGWIQELSTCPVRFEGEEGWVEVGDSGGIVVSPDSLQREVDAMPRNVSGLGVKAHSRNWLDCIRSRQLASANSQVMRNSHIACHTAAIAWMLNRPLILDPLHESFIGDHEANGLRERASRNWQG